MTPEPSLPQPRWRPASAADLPALRRLADACREADGGIAPGAQDSLAALLQGQEPSAALCAVQEDGSLLAFGWLVPGPELAQPYCTLHCLVDPAWRAGQLHEALLRWGEQRAAQLAAGWPARRSLQLRVELLNLDDSLARLYLAHGLERSFAEDVMQRDLRQPLPEVVPPQGFAVLPWSAERVEDFYQCYYDAFRDRPGFPGWSRDEWLGWIAGSDDFQPDLSLLGLVAGQPAGFIVCEAFEYGGSQVGWIAQMGVRPSWRGRGVGATLLGLALQRLQAAGLQAALLDVNVNNPAAARLYRRLGFELLNRRSVLLKPVQVLA